MNEGRGQVRSRPFFPAFVEIVYGIVGLYLNPPFLRHIEADVPKNSTCK